MGVLRFVVALAAFTLDAPLATATFPHYNRQESLPASIATVNVSTQSTTVQSQLAGQDGSATIGPSTWSGFVTPPIFLSTVSVSILPSTPLISTQLNSQIIGPSTSVTIISSTVTSQTSTQPSSQPVGSSTSVAILSSTAVSPISTQLGTQLAGSSTAASQDSTQIGAQPTESSFPTIITTIPTTASEAVTQPGTGLGSQVTEPSVSTTVTSLPTGALVETLTDYAYTEGTIITTTSSGSNDPTVVPVIVPIGGPPQICWGCVLSFPTDIQIKVPEFCVNILGLKIGNCPPDDDNNNDDNNDNDDDEDDPDKEHVTVTTPTPTPADTSCTTTITATYESVFCSVTAAADARKREEVTSCSTLVYSTATACDLVVGSTTTTTLPQETACSPEDCGEICDDVEKRELARRAAPARDSQPAPNTWSDPSNYGGDRSRFMRGEVASAYEDDAQHVKLGGVTEEISTSNWVSFSNQPISLAVAGLWGCTSVVVVSRKGAWASHFWENPSFMNRNNRFEMDVIENLRVGHGYPQIYEYGLAQMRNDDLFEPVGHMFDDENDPRIFIMTPRQPVAGDFSETAGEGTIKYPDKLASMQAVLLNIFTPQADVSIVPYSAISQGTMEERGDVEWNTHRGKLLVQYQPAPQSCEGNANPQAQWRVWIEGREIGDRHAEWTPSDTQHLKRDDSCPIDGNGEDSSTQVETSSQIATTAGSNPTQVGTSSQILTGASNSSSLIQTSSQTAPSGSSTPTPTKAACLAATDCGAMVCTGHTVQTCKDGKCVCGSPPVAATECRADSDCEASLTCIEKFEKKCDSGLCACLLQPNTTVAVTTTAAAPPPEETVYTCNLHLHEYAHDESDTSIVVDYTFDSGKGGDSVEGSFTESWDQEYKVLTSETGLPKNITVKLSKELPPGVPESACAQDNDTGGGSGSENFKRCAESQWGQWMVKLSYDGSDWDSRPDQDASKLPHCQVGDWDDHSWDEPWTSPDSERQMDCRFSC